MSTDRTIVSPNLKEKLSDGYVSVKHWTPTIGFVDVFAGLLGPLIASPLVAIVDGAIINKINGDGQPIFANMKASAKLLFTQPHKFFTSYKWSRLTFYCWIVYAGTYVTSNCIKSYKEAHNVSKEEGAVATVLATSAVNMGLTAWVKDPALVRILQQLARSGEVDASKIKPALPVRNISRFLFCVRDSITMFAAFYVADEVGKRIFRQSNGAVSEVNSRRAATYLVPATLQVVSTPIHLSALTLVKNPSGQGLAAEVFREFRPAFFSRVMRIIPAIGLGSNVNNDLRDALLRRGERSGML